MDAFGVAVSCANYTRQMFMLRRQYVQRKAVIMRLSADVTAARARLDDGGGEDADIRRAVLEPLINRATELLGLLKRQTFLSWASKLVFSGSEDGVAAALDLIRAFQEAPAEIRERWTAKQVEDIARDIRFVTETQSTRPRVEINATFVMFLVNRHGDLIDMA